MYFVELVQGLATHNVTCAVLLNPRVRTLRPLWFDAVRDVAARYRFLVFGAQDMVDSVRPHSNDSESVEGHVTDSVAAASLGFDSVSVLNVGSSALQDLTLLLKYFSFVYFQEANKLLDFRRGVDVLMNYSQSHYTATYNKDIRVILQRVVEVLPTTNLIIMTARPTEHNYTTMTPSFLNESVHLTQDGMSSIRELKRRFPLAVLAQF